MIKNPAMMAQYYQELDFVLELMETSAFAEFMKRWRIKPPAPPAVVADRGQWIEEALRVQMRLLAMTRPFPQEKKDAALRWLVEHRRAPVPDPTAEGHLVDFIGEGRQATVPADPAFPHGRKVHTIVAAEGVQVCEVDLTYPVPECGRHRIICRRCGVVAMITAAGRADDPTMVTLQCKE